MPRHSAEEFDIAIDAYNDIMLNAGAVTSRALLDELERRTGKPPQYWHVAELWTVIRSVNATGGDRRKRPGITTDNERYIVHAAELIASRQPVPKVTAQDIRAYFTALPAEEKPANVTAITRATSGQINAVLKAAGYTQYKTGGYITSIPPVRNTDPDVMETTALRILEAAEDPDSGLAERLHDIRYRHKFRDATAEELQAAVLDGFMHAAPETFRDDSAFNRKANRAARAKTKRTIRTYGPTSMSPVEIAEAHYQAYRDLRTAREAAGKTPGIIEDALYFLHATDEEQKEMIEKERARKTRQTAPAGSGTDAENDESH